MVVTWRISASQRQAASVQASRLAVKSSSRGGFVWSTSWPVALIGFALAIAAGFEDARFGVALRSDGSVWTWGDGEEGQLEAALHPERCDCGFDVPENVDVEAVVRLVIRSLGFIPPSGREEAKA